MLNIFLCRCDCVLLVYFAVQYNVRCRQSDNNCMRQSPAQVRFSYQGQEPVYSPKLIHSGFIVGEPIAYADQRALPISYPAFSPKQQRPRAVTSLPLNQSVNWHYQAPQPSRFAPPLRQSYQRLSPSIQKTVSIEDYNQLLESHMELDRQYRNLEEKYEQLLHQKEGKVGNNGKWIERLIEIYKDNVLKESQLLFDKIRLQQKQIELQSRLK